MRSIVHGMALVLMVTAFVPLAEAQAPRGTAERTIGQARLALEYGAPPWSDARSTQLDAALPVGGVWRLGADQRTTFLVEGGAVLIGGVVVEAGGYGLNLRRLAAKEWAFVVFDGSDTNVAASDGQWEVPATLVEKKESAPQLVVDFVDLGQQSSLVVRFGPIELSAPVAPLAARETELSIAGESATSRWFTAAPADFPAGRFVRVGRVGSFYVGDHDGAFEVDLALDGATASVRFSSRDRNKVSERVARDEAALAALKARAGATPSPRVRTALESATSALAELRAELEALAALPEPYEVKVALKGDGTAAGQVGAEVVRRGDQLVVQVRAGDKVGAQPLDESKLLPKAGSAPR